MKRRLLSLLAVIALVSPIAFLPAAATAAQDLPAERNAGPASTEAAGETLPTPHALESDQLLDQDELAALAALESENVELQQLEAGFFGPRIGTIIIIVVALIVLL
jgi:hypothetical protein